MKYEEKTVSENYVYKGKIINLRRDGVVLPNGRSSVREVIEHNGGVGIVALTSENEILLVSQFRYPYRRDLLEIPAGKIDKGEKPLETGKRELLEETGASASVFTPLGMLYPSPGYTNEIIYLYFASGLTFGEKRLDEDEFLDVVRLPLKKAEDMIMSGEITDSKTQIAVLKTCIGLENGMFGKM